MSRHSASTYTNMAMNPSVLQRSQAAADAPPDPANVDASHAEADPAAVAWLN